MKHQAIIHIVKTTVVVLVVSLMYAARAQAFQWSTPTSQGDLDVLWQNFRSDIAIGGSAEGFPFQQCFEQASANHDLPIELLLAVARGESNFEAKAVSSADALGVMQILWPGTANDLGIRTRSQAFTPCVNIDAGAKYLGELIGQFDGNLHAALIAYNRGPGNVSKILKRGNLDRVSWYSGYIWDHLGFVMSRLSNGSLTNYASTGSLRVITFSMPFRAKQLVEHLRKQIPDARFDWFKLGSGRFVVALYYESAEQRKEGQRQLRRMGLLNNG